MAYGSATSSRSNSCGGSANEHTSSHRRSQDSSAVPSSRLSRLYHYTTLGSSLALNAFSDSTKRLFVGGNETQGGLMSSKNIDLLVRKLSRMRGAALKLGQMISFQSENLPLPIQQILQRVQDSADYMPAWQLNRVMAAEFGADWRNEKFASFEGIPMAAASIGQVHKAVLHDGTQVAVKVQYPGVANSISSDLKNLSLLLTASRLLPKGLYLDKTIANARTELAWECDYVREAANTRLFRQLVGEDTTFKIPRVIDACSGQQVITTELLHGVGIAKAEHYSQQTRDYLGSEIMRLCLRELVEFNFMQTDPNWTNFLYNEKSKQIELLDFGACRSFDKTFIDKYCKLLVAAAKKDKASLYSLSVELGYLTGEESAAMRDAHISSILTLAEPFALDAPQALYDFHNQTVTDRVKSFIPVMLRERLAPPPEETYSLHRRLSGHFLLCARLRSKIPCKEIFTTIMTKHGYLPPMSS
ncbi:ABC1 family-domain-containing protein [Protomyces lactucae-debilis]|uniref:ABC1 family-domain-containing protein n=1 Tax=Protomyces lactucae-debilis TaxID=2754530 RepID=A0A1Y2FEV9_PROLT|nr:ABC1 family-domain-containing protein [Protomyces lactucae-debilis]ORY81365.1 ABC1 family-domain-containing protein [Protomyces lactucae-debilis]